MKEERVYLSGKPYMAPEDTEADAEWRENRRCICDAINWLKYSATCWQCVSCGHYTPRRTA